jgi:beta-lactam-binding protein with PASTA domain
VRLPDVEGKAVDVAARVLERRDFNVRVRYEDGAELGGVVLDQTPEAGKSFEGFTVTLTVGAP